MSDTKIGSQEIDSLNNRTSQSYSRPTHQKASVLNKRSHIVLGRKVLEVY